VSGTELTTEWPPNAARMLDSTVNFISEKEAIPCLARKLFSRCGKDAQGLPDGDTVPPMARMGAGNSKLSSARFIGE